MTVLTVARSVAAVVGMDIPDRLFGYSDRTAVELTETIAEAAFVISKAHDWLALAKDLQVPANTTSMPLPADFDRWRQGTSLVNEFGNPLSGIDSDVPDYFPLGGWYVAGGMIHLRNIPGAVAGVYQSRDFVKKNDGTTAAEFTADDDSFVLDERVLKLCAIWQWKANKGLPYGQDFNNYESAIGRAIAHDGPRNIISIGHRPVFGHVKLAWPGILGNPGNVTPPVTPPVDSEPVWDDDAEWGG